MTTTTRGRGRPKKAGTTKRGGLTPAQEEKKLELDKLPPVYKCTKCGLLTSRPEGRFFVVSTLEAYNGNKHYSNLCMKCTNEYFEAFKTRYQNEKFALMLTCAMVGHYFSEALYDQMIQKSDGFALGQYFRCLNGKQYNGKSFVTYLIELNDQGRLFSSPEVIREVRESKWKMGDKRNKTYVVQTLGYDCFDDDTYFDEDRKFLYNTLASYLTEEVAEDPHKLNSAVSLVKNMWQAEKISKAINAALASVKPDSAELQKLIATKTDLQNSINRIAKENAISAGGSGKKGTSVNSLTGIMKAMINDGFDDVKVNAYDARMVDAYQEVAKISMRAIQSELNFTTDDFAKMVAEQSEVITSQNNKIAGQEEQIRQLRLQIANMEQMSKYKNAKKITIVEQQEDFTGDVT